MRNVNNYAVNEVARRLAVQAYRLTRSFPRDEQYVMVPQIRRAAMSVSLNIAEGAGRRTDREFARFLDIASGSSSELESCLLLSDDLGLAPSADIGEVLELTKRTRKMIWGLLKALGP